MISAPVVYAQKQEQYFPFIKWGFFGKSNGEFDHPTGVAIDSKTGDVYVADWGNHRIQKFTSNGTFITKWGSFGTGNGQFNRLSEDGSVVAVDSKTGDVYVMDTARIQKFTSKGTFITKWGSSGSGDRQFNDPYGVAVDSKTGNVYVSEWVNTRIQKLTSNGTFITKWGSFCYLNTSKGCIDPDKSGPMAKGDGQFSSARSVAVDPSSGNVYVADGGNNRIQKFSSNGTFITKWGSHCHLSSPSYPSYIYREIDCIDPDKSGPMAKGDGQFAFGGGNGVGVAIDPSSGNVYVADGGNDRIQKFTSNGTFITKWGSEGFDSGQFVNPSGVAINPSSGNVYVADGENNRIQVFALISPANTKTPFHTVDRTGNFLTYENSTLGIKIQYLSDWKKVESGNNRVTFFSPGLNNSYIFARLVISTFHSGNRTIGELVSNAINAYTKSLPNFKLIDLQGSTSSGSNMTLTYAYGPTRGTINGPTNHITQTYTIKGDKVYIIQGVSSSVYYIPFGSPYIPVIKRMMDTFQIIK